MSSVGGESGPSGVRSSRVAWGGGHFIPPTPSTGPALGGTIPVLWVMAEALKVCEFLFSKTPWNHPEEGFCLT